MDNQRIRFLREILIAGRGSTPTTTIEFSYDDWFVHKPRFFGVPDEEQANARRLYTEWGGIRLEGQESGTTVSHPN